METFLAQYGYIALFAGTFLEGEAFLILAGFLAYQGYLWLPMVMVVSFSGAFVGNLFYYGLGRWKGKSLLLRVSRLGKSYHKVQTFLERYGALSILISQFFYGTRLISAIAFGVVGISFKRFASVQLAATLLWAGVVATVGYFFGETLESLLGDLRKHEGTIIVVLLAAGVAYAWGHLLFRYRRNRSLKKMLMGNLKGGE